MKAAVYSKYGAPSVLKIKEVKKPIPNSHEVLVKIIATSINSADAEMLKGSLLGRLSGIFKPSFKILGSDISGVVEAIGSEVTFFKVGDAVYGDMTESRFGTFAEYKTVNEKALSQKPDYLSFIEAAALPSAGVIALQSVNNRKNLRSGDQVLINGAGGGMGTLAVQITKALGAEVTGIDKKVKLGAVRAIGADHVIDYEVVKYTKLKEHYDRIIDCQAFYGPVKYRRLLKEHGVFYMIGGSVSSLLRMAIFGSLLSSKSTKKLGVLLGRPNKQEDIKRLERLVEEKSIRPIIDKCFKLDDIVTAFEYFETGNFVGKIIIEITDNI